MLSVLVYPNLNPALELEVSVLSYINRVSLIIEEGNYTNCELTVHLIT